MKVVIATGGTGGHLFPAMKVAAVLKQRGDDVTFLGSFRVGLDKLKQEGYSVIQHPAKGLDRSNPLKFLSTGLTIFLSVFFCYLKLKELSPDVVVGFGGYGGYPVVRAAHMLKIPCMLHEQNVVPGGANLKLLRSVDCIAISFKGSEKYFPHGNVTWTGLPVKASRVANKEEAQRFFSFDPQKKTLLVMGGSQGSERIDKEIVQALKSFPEKRDLQVIHLCGPSTYEMLEINYKEMGIPFALYRFLDKIEEAYAIADAVVARAGASTVAELGLFLKRSILIPYRFAGGHQIENAKVLEQIGLAVVLDERKLDPQLLGSAIKNALKGSFALENPDKIKNIFADQAEKNIVNLIDQLAHEI